MNATRTLLPLLGALPIVAQTERRPRDFYPSEFNAQVVIDIAALDEAGVLGTIERSPASMLLGQFREAFGFDLADVDRFEFAGRIDDNQRSRDAIEPVMIFTGQSSRIRIDEFEPTSMGSRYDFEEIGGHQAVAGKNPTDAIVVSPQPGCLAIGNRRHLEPILTGERRAGVPSPELLALTAGKPALFVGAIAIPENPEHPSNFHPFPSGWLEADDALTSIAGRLGEVDGNLVLLATIGFAKGAGGRDKFEEQLLDGLEELRSQPEAAMMAPLFKLLDKVRVTKPGRELRLTLDLGPTAGATAQLTQLVMPLIMVGTVRRDVAVEAARAEAEAALLRAKEQAEKAKKDAEKKKKKKGG